ncbi:MAG: hypothetical protein CVT98_10805, partial [Bacteroidetes bacterium HGW-Bacteroidetes-15]
ALSLSAEQAIAVKLTMFMFCISESYAFLKRAEQSKKMLRWNGLKNPRSLLCLGLLVLEIVKLKIF